MAELTNEELLAELGIDIPTKKIIKRTAREERIIAGFEDIQRFYELHNRAPQHGEHHDIFERIYATRLDQIKASQECLDLVTELDHQNLLETSQANPFEALADEDIDAALLAELGVDVEVENDITVLTHVKPRSEVHKAEEIGSRKVCDDFDVFRPMFDTVQSALQNGTKKSLLLEKQPPIKTGDWFILQGQKAYIADEGERYMTTFNRKDWRLRVIFDNGTESNLLMRSMQKALSKDETARRIVDLSAGPLFDDVAEENEIASGTIYVLRSDSKLTEIVQHRDTIHKIGVTGGDLKKRLADAKNDPTFLLADVEVVASYTLYHINPHKLENLIHRFFAAARLDIEIQDRFGKPVKPREWFMVPLSAIDEMVNKLLDGTLETCEYSVKEAKLIPRCGE